MVLAIPVSAQTMSKKMVEAVNSGSPRPIIPSVSRSVSEQAFAGLRWAVSQKMVAAESPFAQKLRQSCVLLQRLGLDEAAAATGIKPTVLLRLVDLGGQTHEGQTTDPERNAPALPKPDTARDVAHRYSRQSP